MLIKRSSDVLINSGGGGDRSGCNALIIVISGEGEGDGEREGSGWAIIIAIGARMPKGNGGIACV